MTKTDRAVYEKQVAIIRERMRTGHPMFGDNGRLKDYLAKLNSDKK